MKQLQSDKFEKLRYRILKRKYQVARNQARFREQEWLLTQDEYFALWESEALAWLDSGRGGDDWNLSRKNMEQGWTLDNVHIIQRRAMLVAEGRTTRMRNAREKS